MIEVRIPGEPFAQPRARSRIVQPRNGGKPFVSLYDPKHAKEWKARAAWAMQAAMVGQAPLTGPVALSIVARFTCPRSDYRTKVPRAARWHTKRPDLDNVVKAVKDAAKGILWLDDSQVVALTAWKLVGEQGASPGLVVTLWSLPDVGAALFAGYRFDPGPGR